MTTKEDLLAYVKNKMKLHDNNPEAKPIFALYLFENPDKELVSKDGKHLGWPDTGNSYEPGFYHNLDWAIEAMNQNAGDIRETCYDAGFILCRFPGLYDGVTTNARMYFVWNNEKQGFFQQEEPAIFEHIAY